MQFATPEVPTPTTSNSTFHTPSPEPHPVQKTPQELATIASQFATSDGWLNRVQLRHEGRWYERLHHGPDYDIWAISWMPGQSTGFHDHGGSAGAFVVRIGALEEHRPGQQPVEILPGQPRAFAADYAHDVRNASDDPAISIHAYSPPLTEMNEYDLDGSHLVPRNVVSERAASLQPDRQAPETDTNHNISRIDRMLSVARSRLLRLFPDEAHEDVTHAGAVLVDIRPEAQRALEGTIPGALIVERNVLEWRFDPTSSARLPQATNYDLQVIIFCSEGYTSSLAAASLQKLGLWRATDIVGGFQAWQAAGLPTS